MLEILFLLLPLAFYSGWSASRKRYKKRHEDRRENSTRFVKGINFLLSEQPDKALDTFLAHPEVDDYTAETYLLLGNLFRERGEVTRALRVHQYLLARPDLKKAQRLAAMEASGHDFLASGLLDRAERVFRELLDENPKHHAACEPLREIYEQLHEWDKAIEVAKCQASADKTLAKRLTAHYYCEQAHELLASNQLYLAEEKLKLANSSQKALPRIAILKAQLLLQQEQPDKAFKQFKAALDADVRLTDLVFPMLLKHFPDQSGLERTLQLLKHLFEQHQAPSVLAAMAQLMNQLQRSAELEPYLATFIQQGKPSLRTLSQLSALAVEHELPIAPEQMSQALARLAKTLPEFHCEQCGYKMHDYLWRCPACHTWDSVESL